MRTTYIATMHMAYGSAEQLDIQHICNEIPGVRARLMRSEEVLKIKTELDINDVVKRVNNTYNKKFKCNTTAIKSVKKV